MSHCNLTAIAESSAFFKVMKIVKVKKIEDPPFWIIIFLRKSKRNKAEKHVFLAVSFQLLGASSAMFHGLSQCFPNIFFYLILFSAKSMEMSFAIRQLPAANRYCGDPQWDIFPFGGTLISLILCKYWNWDLFNLLVQASYGLLRVMTDFQFYASIQRTP